MGLYQSTPAFVEPLAYGYEDDVKNDQFVIIKSTMEPVEVPRLQKTACMHCIRRTRKYIKIEETIHRQYLKSLEQRALSLQLLEAAREATLEALQHLKFTADKYHLETADLDKAPAYLRRQLRDAHNQKKLAMMTESYSTYRIERKTRAVVNLEQVYQASRGRTLAAMNKQIQCSVKCSRLVKNP